MRLDRRRLADWSPYLVAVVIAALYAAFAPHTADLASQTAREELFRRSGFVAFWWGWYSGIPSAEYSLLTPPLLGVFGAVGLGSLSIVATSLVVVPMLRDAVRPRAGAIAFVLAASLDVASGRTTFAVGCVVALGAVLALERGSVPLCAALAALATVTSPVAGFLLLVAAVTVIIADVSRRAAAIGLGAGVVAALGLVALLSQGAAGYEPFSRSSLFMAVGTTAVVGLAPVGRRIRIAAGVTIAMLVGVFFVHSPLGANATRIAVLAAAPTIVAASRLTQRHLMIAAGAVAAVLPIAQFHNDLYASTAKDTSRAFVAPLLDQLLVDPVTRDHRVEIVDTATHWPSTYLLPKVVLARGWERQIDEVRNPMFYGRGPLTAKTYRAWLNRNAVGAIAVPTGVPLDYGVTREAALLKTGLPYLQLVWSDQHWQLYTVDQPRPIIAAPAKVVRLTDTGLTLEVPSAGNYLLRMQWSQYLSVSGGTVIRRPNNQVELSLSSSGLHQLRAVWRFG
ncbi:MAG TPA: hypothetical protein VME70_06975 [Mycobacteriales bacterium]|nr:hypothetical protein [Mycobacteriales bacterium]